MAYLKFPFDSDKGIIDLYNIIKNEKVKFPAEPLYSKKLKYLIFLSSPYSICRKRNKKDIE